MSTVFGSFSDTWGLVYTYPGEPYPTNGITVPKVPAGGSFVAIATSLTIPSTGAWGIRISNGVANETVRLYLGSYLTGAPPNSIAVDLLTVPITLALTYTSTPTRKIEASYSLDGLTYVALGTITGLAAPTSVELFYEQFNGNESTSVSFQNFRVLSGIMSLPYPTSEEYFLPITVGTTTQPPALSSTQEAVIHALVAAQFGDLEFDIGKSVRWTQWFADDVFITDVNYGSQRFWIIDWTKSFPYVNYQTSSTASFFDNPVAFRKQQFADAEQFARDNEEALVFDNEDWVLFVDAHEALGIDNRPPYPPDVEFEPFRSYVSSEIRKAIEAGKDRISLPFFAFVRHGDIQNVEYDWVPNQPADEQKCVQAMGVPYYVPYSRLVRIIKVSTLRNPSFDWSSIDTPVPVCLDPAVGTVSTPHNVNLNLAGATQYRLSVSAQVSSMTGPYSELVTKASGFDINYYIYLNQGANNVTTRFSEPTATNYQDIVIHSPIPYGTEAHTYAVDFITGTTTLASWFDGVKTVRAATSNIRNINVNAPVVVGNAALVGQIYWAQLERLDAGGNVVALVWRFDPTERLGTGTTYTDPRGRVWTLTNANAIVPAVATVPAEPAAKLQIISYGYAHWNLQDIPPGETGVAALNAENDLGWRQRNLLSKVRPVPGLPYGEAWQFPNTDTPGLAGPWAPDTFSTQITGVVIPETRPPIDTACAGVLIQLYDTSLRLNVRDGVWYAGNGLGNVPLEWDAEDERWVAAEVAVT